VVALAEVAYWSRLLALAGAAREVAARANAAARAIRGFLAVMWCLSWLRFVKAVLPHSIP
jgi:hypothetical protein